MTLTPRMFLIVCPLLFLAGFVDSIGGGGGLISLPAYLFAGLPVHAAVATNKLSSACGTSVVTARFIKNGLVNFRVVLPGAAAACNMLGGYVGAGLAMEKGTKITRPTILIVLLLLLFKILTQR